MFKEGQIVRQVNSMDWWVEDSTDSFSKTYDEGTLWKVINFDGGEEEGDYEQVDVKNLLDGLVAVGCDSYEFEAL